MHINFEKKVYKLCHTRTGKFYLYFGLRSFVISLVGIFIPVYLYYKGFPLEEILFFYIYYYLFANFTTSLALKLLNKLGYPKLFLISAVSHFLFFLLLPQVNSFLELCLIGSLSSFGVIFFWIPLNYVFSKTKMDKVEVSCKQNATGVIASALAPLIGGIIATIFSFKFLFSISAIGIILAPIFLFRHEKIRINKEKLEIRTPFFKGLAKNSLFFYEGLSLVSSFIAWPLFIYILFSSVSMVGFANTIINLSVAFLTLNLVHILKRHKEELLNYSTKLYSFSLLFRPFVVTPLSLIAISSILGVCSAFFNIAYNAYFYEVGRRKTREFLFFREIMLNLGRVFGICIILILLHLNFNPLQCFATSLVIGALANYMLINIKHYV